ncbi:MAG TPA: twin-arginine translocase TatA/TatE family subunit [Thermoanaerobaculia bacterium]|jgi:sec-independent protein translocase protein TatA|nr:twin-arginine translocase TatA/TatE family subunit [Thermoanaerobaculia bacterium]HUP42948.1 twin-arginine translocase TatA/TatE family subunit [Thermoanaerobaculia bacterium]
MLGPGLSELTVLALIPTLGVTELLVIFLIIVVIFGASKLPQLGRGLGEGISNFKKGLKEKEAEREALEDGEKVQPK